MNTTNYYIDGRKYTFPIDSSIPLSNGLNEVLSNPTTDIVYSQTWYKDGFIENDLMTMPEFSFLKQGLIDSIGKIIQEETATDIIGFNLENYHHYIKTNEDHFKVVSKTRDLFSSDFNFPLNKVLSKLASILQFPLTDIDPTSGQKMHIIVRINRPQSSDFNPPHKDIYEGVDQEKQIPLFVNFWIPIAGVTNKSNLPLVPGSHRINENQIVRTFEGGKIAGNQYRVRLIKSWNGKTELERSKVKYGQVLIFTSHLIHGLAVNEEEDKTRVALEFRLYRR